MITYKNTILGCLALLALSSCQKEQITPNRGKVKFETISVSSKLAGRIEKIFVSEGQTVKKGDTLAILNIPEVHAKMMQADGAITAAKGQLNRAFYGGDISSIGPEIRILVAIILVAIVAMGLLLQIKINRLNKKQ